MKVVSTFFASSSILHSVKCRVDTSGVEYLAVAHSSNLELFALLAQGAKLQCRLDIWGTISSLTVVPHTVNKMLSFSCQGLMLEQDAPDTLLVTTETPDPLAILLEYVPETGGYEPFLREYSHLSLYSSHSRTMEHFQGAIVHPSGDVAIVATYVGKLKALVLKGNQRKKIKAEFDCMSVTILYLPVAVS